MGSITPHQAEEAALEVFGIRASARRLAGEFDHNFLLEAAGGPRYVLKFQHPRWEDAELDLQNRALERLASAIPEVGWPRVVPSRAGEEISFWQAGRLRLLTWLDGTFLSSLRPVGEETAGDLGRFLGRLDGALADLEHPAMERRLIWEMGGAADLIREYLEEVPDARRRELLGKLAGEASSGVISRLAGLRRSVIHNDANDHNVLIDKEGRVCGIIDFGDMIRTWTVCEPAVACAYAMMDEPDPEAVAAWLVSGYHGSMPLTGPEITILPDLIRLRLGVSVSLSSHRRRTEPENEYLTVSEAAAWGLLEYLTPSRCERLSERLLRACLP